MQLSTQCPYCSVRIKVRDNMVGQIARCPKCREKFEVSSFSSGGDGGDAAAVSISETMDGSAIKTAGGASKQESSSNEGVALGRFRLQKVLGQGGFGKVYRAWDPQLERMLAIKVPTFSSNDTKRVQRFLTEAKAAARLRHPNIVPTFESGHVDGKYFIAAQFIAGQALNDVIKSGNYERRAALEWTVSLASAISYAHTNDIVHRDIKPHNVMIDESGQPQLMDFGLARRGDEESTQTTDGTLLGTPAYMPPEQARGALSEIGPWSDQYSLGVILYEILTGQRPFHGEPHAVINQVLTEVPASPRSLDKTIPRDLDSICRKAMAKLPADRYADCDAFAEDLRRWLRGESTKARPLPIHRVFWRWMRKNPVIGAAAVVCMAAIASVAVLAVAVAIDQSKRNEAAEAALNIAEQRKDEALLANTTLAENDKTMRQTVDRKNTAVKESEESKRLAQEQAALAVEERAKAKTLLLNSQLQQLDFEKQQLMFPEAISSIDAALVTAEELKETNITDGLRLDRNLLKSLSVLEPVPNDDEAVRSGLFQLNERFSLSPKGPDSWRVFDRKTSTEVGDEFVLTLTTSDGTVNRSAASNGDLAMVFPERMVRITVAGDKLIWLTVSSDIDSRFWGRLRKHEVLLENGKYSVADGPQMMLVARDSTTVPVWMSPNGERMAYRSRENSSEITITRVSDADSSVTIESPEALFREAAFDPSGTSLAIVEQDQNDRLSLTLHSPDKARGKNTLIRGADRIRLEPDGSLCVIVKGKTSEVRSLQNGAVLGTFPSLTGETLCRLSPDKTVGILNSFKVMLSGTGNDNANLRTFDTSRLGLLDQFELLKDGLAIGDRADRQFALDLNSRLVIGSAMRAATRDGIPSHYGDRLLVPNLDRPHPAPTAGEWITGSFIDSNRIVLLQPEFHEFVQLAGNQAYRYEVERWKSLAVMTLNEHPAASMVTPLEGFAGRQRIKSVSATSNSASGDIDPKQIVTADVLQRLSVSEDAVTLSHNGQFAAVRNVQNTFSLGLYNLNTRLPHGNQHLTEPTLLDVAAKQDLHGTFHSFKGQVRFNPTDELFVYRVNSLSLGLVSVNTGQRIGKPLAIPKGRQIAEVDWSADSKSVWAVTTVKNTQPQIQLWDTVSGEMQSQDVSMKADLVSCRVSASGQVLLLQSSSGDLATVNTTTKQVVLYSNSNANNRNVEAGFWGVDEHVFCTTRSDDTNLPAFALWHASPQQKSTISSEPGRLVLPGFLGKVPIHGMLSLGDSRIPVTEVQRKEIDKDSDPVVILQTSIPIDSLVTSPDGSLLLTVDASGESQLWHAQSGRPIGPPISDVILWPDSETSKPKRRYQFSPTGGFLLVTQNSRLVAVIHLPMR